MPLLAAALALAAFATAGPAAAAAFTTAAAAAASAFLAAFVSYATGVSACRFLSHCNLLWTQLNGATSVPTAVATVPLLFS